MNDTNQENQVQAENELVVDVVEPTENLAETEAVETNSGGDLSLRHI